MPVVFQKRICRDDLRANPEVLYLFGDNDKRRGRGGQAAQMRDEPNAVGIRTKWEPSSEPQAFFKDTDEAYKIQVMMIAQDMEPAIDHAKRGGVVIIPLDGLGTGRAQLARRAPRTAMFLQRFIWKLTNGSKT